MIAEQIGDAAAHYAAWADENPYKATALETAGVFIGRQLLHAAGTRVGLNLGNALTTTDEANTEFAERPLLSVVVGIGVMPVVEELGTRALPAKIATVIESSGRPTAANRFRHNVDLLFGGWHSGLLRPGFKDDTLQPTLRLRQPGESLSLPVSQYIGGRNLRRIYEQRGLGAAILAHSLNNGLAFAVALKRQSK